MAKKKARKKMVLTLELSRDLLAFYEEVARLTHLSVGRVLGVALTIAALRTLREAGKWPRKRSR